MTSGAGEQNSTQSWVMCEVVTGVNPWLSHQHPHGLLSLKCVRTHTSYSPGESGKCRPEAQLGGSHLITGVWHGTEEDSTGDTFSIYLALFLVNLFSKQFLCGWLGNRKSLQTNNVAVLIFPQLLPSQHGNDILCHGYWAWLWLVRRLSTISIRNTTAA